MTTKAYKVQEIFYSLVGEGAQVGRPAVFVRFHGCNLWNGDESMRRRAACNFCDTDFISMTGTFSGEYDSSALADMVSKIWLDQQTTRPLAGRYVVLTGGEPALQVDEALIAQLHQHGFSVAIETNGTRSLPHGIDWVCVSPKGTASLKIQAGQELKLVFPQEGVDPDKFSNLAFGHFFIQPKDAPGKNHWSEAKEYCLKNSFWKLSLQMHKVLGLR